MRLLGISCDYHDAAAALVIDGRVVAAAQEERFTRVKHDDGLPRNAAASCLAIAGIEADDLDAIVLHEKPLAVLNRVVAARQRRGPAALGRFAREMPSMVGRNLLVGYRAEQLGRRLGATRPVPIRYGEHHLSHAAAAFLPSPYETAAILTVDGIGEWATASIGQGLRNRVELLAEQRFPNSLGLLYSLATVWCGFAANDGEYKLMGLAPFGEPRYRDALADLVELHPDGSLRVDARALRWWSARPTRMGTVARLLDGPPRRPDGPLDRRHADIARSVQDLTETALLRMAEHAHRLTGERNLCLAGGVALNCVANGRIRREGPFDDVWIQPAAGDAGSALGAALWYWHDVEGHPRERAERTHPDALDDAMSAAALGPRFDDDEVVAHLTAEGIDHRHVPDVEARCREVARRLADGAIVGWVEGRMEFGPRALGNRSILADPRSATVQAELNRRVKGREGFRPFAPAVLWERAADWFEIDAPSPYMLTTHQVRAERRLDPGPEPSDLAERAAVARSQIPACTHVDGSARVQTVHRETRPAFHLLLEEFEAITGCPMLLNTSLNRAGEPIVCTPDQALATARAAGLDVLVLEGSIIELARPAGGP
jgi:carbamoyltransferase